MHLKNVFIFIFIIVLIYPLYSSVFYYSFQKPIQFIENKNQTIGNSVIPKEYRFFVKNNLMIYFSEDNELNNLNILNTQQALKLLNAQQNCIKNINIFGDLNSSLIYSKNSDNNVININILNPTELTALKLINSNNNKISLLNRVINQYMILINSNNNVITDKNSFEC